MIISCIERKDEGSDLLLQIPDNPISVISINDFSILSYDEKIFIRDYFDASFFEKELFTSLNKFIYSKHKIGKQDFGKLFFLEKNGLNRNIIFKDSIDYDEKKIFLFDNNNLDYYLTKYLNFDVISDNRFLIENFLRGSNYKSNTNSQNFFDLVKTRSNNVSIFVSEDFNSTKLEELNINLSDISDWINFEFEIKNDEIIIIGLSKLDSKKRSFGLIKNIKPQKNEILKILPNDFTLFKSYSFNKDYSEKNINNLINKNSNEEINLNPILSGSDEFGYFFNDKDSVFIIKNDQYRIDTLDINFKLQKKYRDEKIYLNENFKLVIDKINEFNFIGDKVYLTQIDENIIVSKNIESIERLILSYYNKSTFLLNADLNDYLKNIPTKNSSLELVKLTNNENELSVWIKSNQIKDSIIYSSLYNSKTRIQKNINKTKLVLSKSFPNEIIIKPKIIHNHKTKEKNIIFQDSDNKLILIEFSGKIIWSKKLNGSINSDIFQVDTYKNNKLQFLFSTSKELILLDINGDIVKKIDVKSKNYFKNLSVFDYDKNKNYRYVIQDASNLKMYNSSFEIVKGFKKIKLNNGLKEPLKHLRILNRDYLILKNNEDKISILDRRGNIRIKLPKDLSFNTNLFKHDNGMIAFDNNNNILRIDINGKIYKQKLVDNEKILFANNKYKITFGTNKLIVNGKDYRLPFGSYQDLKIQNFSNDLYYSIFDKDSNKIYLFKNYNIIPGFPFFSSSDLDLNYTNNTINALFLGDKNEIQLYSFN